MTKDEALRLALEALKEITLEHGMTEKARTAIKAALEVKDDPVACGACNGSGRMVRDPDIGTDQECFVCEGALEAKDEPWSPVSIGVDVTKEGAHVVGIYALDADTSQIFYAKHHPVPQRTWVGLTDEEMNLMGVQWHFNLLEAKDKADLFAFARAIEAAHGIKGEK